ncbi:SDR family NAD(P)-dependent oxidoreductase [Bacillus sp. 03113]|uniref:SDR family NAD(P)-dependent oxidoreductase n=1 Tax=Bacillus sp. 03113 TaxID=2578211 RepID=UPI00114369FA|nr:SDR family NAD(P)-dependent oxidoreductase [Bacillus sp. 03113]
MDSIRTKQEWNLHGKYVVITGATNGIGLAAAKALAARGANLGIVARNKSKADEVASQIKHLTNNRSIVDVFIADMASQRSISQVAAEILDSCFKVDVLVNNAGALFETRQITEDGVEMTWAVNHLAPFLLTSLLLDRLKESASARVITTTSHGHKMVKKGIEFSDLSSERFYSGFKKLMGGPTLCYAQSKLGNILFTSELARRLEGSNVTAHCFDPGLVATNFNQNNSALARATMAVMKPFSRTPEEGADTLVWLAEVSDITGLNGQYCADRQVMTPSDMAIDKEAAKRLWEISEEQVRKSGTLE